MVPAPAADTAPVSDAEIQPGTRPSRPTSARRRTVTLEYVRGRRADTCRAPPRPTRPRCASATKSESDALQSAEQRLASHILVQRRGRRQCRSRGRRREARPAPGRAGRAPGADFAALARSNSEDRGSKAAAATWAGSSQGVMTSRFEDALFAMQPGQVSGPVKTDFGWHVIQLRELKVRPDASRSRRCARSWRANRPRPTASAPTTTSPASWSTRSTESDVAGAGRARDRGCRCRRPARSRAAPARHRRAPGGAACGVLRDAGAGRHGQRSDRDRARTTAC